MVRTILRLTLLAAFVGAASADRSLQWAEALEFINAAPTTAPPPPPPTTPRDTLRNLALSWLGSWLRDNAFSVAAQSGESSSPFLSSPFWQTFAAPFIQERLGIVSAMSGEPKLDPVDLSQLAPFQTSSEESTFVQKLLGDDYPVGELIRTDEGFADRLCESSFLRGVSGSGYDVSEVNDAWNNASPLRSEGVLPMGCTRGCVIGGGWVEQLARIYGIGRTLTTSSWRGKCFSDEIVPEPVDRNSTGPYQPGSKVTNRIKLNYGLTMNNLFGLTEPVNTLFPGRVYVGESLASPSESAMIVDYSDHDHEFSPFRDEIREIYPGVYLGKMYALPGASLWDGAIALSSDEPTFAIHFILFKQPGQSLAQAHGNIAA
jgi:hypothetical protein